MNFDVQIIVSFFGERTVPIAQGFDAFSPDVDQKELEELYFHQCCSRSGRVPPGFRCYGLSPRSQGRAQSLPLFRPDLLIGINPMLFFFYTLDLHYPFFHSK
jgi:hypothetical protein